jgi:hypothetical protein
VKGKERERLLELCALAANEPDHDRLMELVQEINELFEASERSEATKSASDRNKPAHPGVVKTP